jgi:peptide/nickel transport system permease protein
MATQQLTELQQQQAELWEEVRRIGFLRQIWQARRWHGVDWWLAVISAIGLLVFIIMALFPSVFAPYPYNKEAGPAKMAPFQKPSSHIMIVRSDSGYGSIEEIDDAATKASEAPKIGSTNDVASRVVGLLRDEDILVRPMRLQSDNKDVTPEEALNQLMAGDLDGLVGDEVDYNALLEDYPDLEVLGAVGPTYNSTFIFGTTQLGYDVFSRIIYGSRTTLLIGLTSALFACLVGIPIGLLSGFVGGTLDRVLTLVMDSIYSFPGLILAIAIASVLGPSVGNIILAIAVLYVPTYFRIVRGQTLTIKQSLYVEAARSLGAKKVIILARYIFPNVLASVVVIFSVNVADAILTGAGLSFLGLGLPETIPDWGVDLARGQEDLRVAWWLVTFPGLAIALLTLCFSLLGESLSEMLNPRLNRN